MAARPADPVDVRLSRRLSRRLQWLLLPHGFGWSYYLFYVWVNLYGLMATSLLWLQANATFNAREAADSSDSSTAGILGAIVGGWTDQLAGASAGDGESAGCLCRNAVRLFGAALSSRSRYGRHTSTVEGADDSTWKVISSSQLLSLLASMGGLVAVVAAIIDVQFNQIVDNAFVNRDDKTAFFGGFFASLSAFALVFQILVTPRVLRHLGVIPALLFLRPHGPRLDRRALRARSVRRCPAQDRRRRSAPLDPQVGDGDPLSAGPPRDQEAGRRCCSTRRSTMSRPVSARLSCWARWRWVSATPTCRGSRSVWIALWIGLIRRSRRAYVDTFRRALDRREIDLSEYTVDVSEAGTIESLLEGLHPDGSARRLSYALDMVASVGAQRSRSALPLLEHEEGDVRERALRVLHRQTGEMPNQRFEAGCSGRSSRDTSAGSVRPVPARRGHRSERLRRALQDERREGRRRQWPVSPSTAATEHEIAGRGAGSSSRRPRRRRRARTGAGRTAAGQSDQRDRRPYVRAASSELLGSEMPAVVRQLIVSMGQSPDEALLPRHRRA